MNYITIPLSTKKFFRKRAKVDQEFSYLKTFNWHFQTKGYASAWSTNHKKTMLMHTLIMERVLGRPLAHFEIVDHINGDKLDNRVENLRVVTPKENSNNLKSPIKHKKSIVVDTLYINMDARRQSPITFAEAADLVGVTKSRMHQLRADLSDDSRFVIVPSPHHRQMLLIGIR